MSPEQDCIKKISPQGV